MMPGRAQIERLVPQRGTMCLLDRVTGWDDAQIVCGAPAPDASHPLARGAAVPAIAGCEYAAQAAALHGALVDARGAATAGLLAKLMDVDLHRRTLPAGAALTVKAQLHGRVERGCLYAFEVESGGRPVVTGRLMVAYEEARE